MDTKSTNDDIYNLLAVNDHLLGLPPHLGSAELRQSRLAVEDYAAAMAVGGEVPAWFKRAMAVGQTAMSAPPIQANSNDIGF